MQVDIPKVSDSWTYRLMVPINTITVVLCLAKAFGLLDVSWWLAVSPALAFVILMGVMAEYGLWICLHLEEEEKNHD